LSIVRNAHIPIRPRRVRARRRIILAKSSAVLDTSSRPIRDADKLAGGVGIAVLVGICRRRLDDGWARRGSEIGGGIDLHSAGTAADFGGCGGAGDGTDAGHRSVEYSVTAVTGALVFDPEKHVWPAGELGAGPGVAVAVSGASLDAELSSVRWADERTFTAPVVKEACEVIVTVSGCDPLSGDWCSSGCN